MMAKLTFSGHESFHCRSLWLKKGYDFIAQERNFNSPDSVVDLGVGKNMVSSINFWMKSFGLVKKENKISDFANFIFGKNGVDPYLENPATLWLLHYHLVTESYASIYSLVFNDFRKKRIEFNKIQLLNFLKHKCEEFSTLFNENTVNRDITVFLRNYVRPTNVNKNIEDQFSGLLIDIDIVTALKKYDEEESSWYKIENKERQDLPAEIVLFGILCNDKYEDSITFDELLFGGNSIGNIFALSPKGLLWKIEIITKKYKSITFTEDAGIRVLQFKSKPNKWDVLKHYYAK